MKTKAEIVAALAQTEDDRILLASLLDKAHTCQMQSYMTHTKFLDPREHALCAQALQLAGLGQGAVFWGGYAEAERGIYLFYPDYMTVEQAREQAPIALLRAHKNKEDTLTHRDYLGALMGLKIERSRLGDILVHEQGADLLVLEEMAEFVLLHFGQAGRKRISLSRLPLDQLHTAPISYRTGSGSVASLRLDNVVALLFGLGRGQAQGYIEKGLVLVDGLPCLKPDRPLTQAVRLTVRGLGRARITELGGKSRKGRQFVCFERQQ